MYCTQRQNVATHPILSQRLESAQIQKKQISKHNITMCLLQKNSAILSISRAIDTNSIHFTVSILYSRCCPLVYTRVSFCCPSSTHCKIDASSWLKYCRISGSIHRKVLIVNSARSPHFIHSYRLVVATIIPAIGCNKIVTSKMRKERESLSSSSRDGLKLNTTMTRPQIYYRVRHVRFLTAVKTVGNGEKG